MNVSLSWLRALAPSISPDPSEVAERLASLGAPVDEVVEIGAPLRDIVIARVEEVRPHPNADRLRVCVVNAGGEALQVVCGAPNVRADAFYPFAPVGASLPGGVQIRKAKLRGEASQGMLCSARELGLGREHAGLMALAGEWEPGEPLVDALQLDDTRLVLDITPNRPDLLSHLGVAREAAPGGVAELRLPPFPGSVPAALRFVDSTTEGETGGVRVRIARSDDCPRYAAAVVRGVRVGPSPEWLAGRLRAIGQRPINNVVDATNYVLHELGQPLHAFDLGRLRGGQIIVRDAAPGERLRTLDGVERELESEVLVIADAEGPVALAGVMGGKKSEVTGETADILIECALFAPQTVRRTARRFGLATDAAYRFERGVDPEGQQTALRRVVELIVVVAGGEPEPEAADLSPVPPVRREVDLRLGRVEQLLGVPLDREEIAGLLRPLGFQVEEAAEGVLRVGVPGFRPDVTRDVDLIEEVARRRGYDSFPATLGPFRPGTVPTDPEVELHARLRARMVRWGFLEARTSAFAPDGAGQVPLLNPLSAEEGRLRGALLPGLLRRVEHNWAHGIRDIRLFEVATVFAPGTGPLPSEEVHLAAVFTGARTPPHWSAAAADWDVWDLRGLLEELASELGMGSPRQGVPGELGRWLDPSLVLHLSGASPSGGGGRVARGEVDAPAWAAPLWAFEIPAEDESPRGNKLRFRALPQQPAAERDLALLLPAGVAAEEVRATVVEHAGPALESLVPFDVYTGEGVPAGTRSVAWRLRFRAPDRTLVDAEVDAAVARVVHELGERHGVVRR